MKIAEMAIQERPRERLLAGGALSTTELLAVLLGSGTKELSVLDLAATMLAHFGTVQALLEASIQELCQFPGIGPARALQLKAAFGLAVRYRHKKATSVDDLYEWIAPDFAGAKEERFLAICLDAQKKPFHKEVLAVGTLSEVLVHPREVFHYAVRHKAHTLLAIHNHPSGDPRPSKPDLLLTERLRLCGQMMGIPLRDHLILAGDRLLSLLDAKEGAPLYAVV